MKKTTNKLRVAAFAAVMLLAGSVSAQTTTATAAAATTTTNFGRQGDGNGTLGTSDTAVRVVDNKGTIKYLQAANGLTTFTDTAPNGGIITTWQLGGTLADDTYIDATGAVFAIDGIASVTDAEIAALASANIVDGSIANPNNPANAVPATAPGTGFAFLVRDEVTGETKKLNIADLIASEAAEFTITATEDVTGANSLTLNLGLAATDANKILVYRNGVKLRGTVGATAADYTVDATGLILIITPPNADWDFYAGDIIEYYYSR